MLLHFNDKEVDSIANNGLYLIPVAESFYLCLRNKLLLRNSSCSVSVLLLLPTIVRPMLRKYCYVHGLLQCMVLPPPPNRMKSVGDKIRDLPLVYRHNRLGSSLGLAVVQFYTLLLILIYWV